MITKQIEKILFLLWAVLLALSGVAQTYEATHTGVGYAVPGSTVTINCQFSEDNTTAFDEFAWEVTLPAGWAVISASGGGFSSWDIFDEVDDTGAFFLSPNGNPELCPIPITFSFVVSVPSGFVGNGEIRAEVLYKFRNMLVRQSVWANPDPLVINEVPKTLQIISSYGTATPAVGIYTNDVGTLLTPSVTQYSEYLGTTQYVCTGWSMTGNAPLSGTTNHFTMTHTADAVLTWNWQLYNVKPVVTNVMAVTGYRLKANNWTKAQIFGNVLDPDPQETLTLLSADTTGIKGQVSLTEDGINYVPPTHTDAVVDTFTYTVQDSKGATAVGVVEVKVTYGATAIIFF